MVITFVIGDMYGHRLDMMYTGKAPTMKKRVASIELTPEQIAKISLKKVGVDLGKDQYEEIMEIFLEESNDTN
jgi:hypothetical protein